MSNLQNHLRIIQLNLRKFKPFVDHSQSFSKKNDITQVMASTNKLFIYIYLQIHLIV